MPVNPPVRYRRTGRRWAVRDFVRRVYKKAEQDNIFFLAGAISFNILVAVLPLILAALGIAGLILQAQPDIDPTAQLMAYIGNALPNAGVELEQTILNIITGIRESSGGLATLGTVIFLWVATRLIGTLRTVLREIFDLQQDRGIVAGKIFDLKMVVAATILFTINLGITFYIDWVAKYGIEFLNVPARPATGMMTLLSYALAFLPLWILFILIYRYLPARRIQWSTALVAATFTGVCFELLKFGFSYYAQRANYSSAYGTAATAIVLFLWIYYASIIFIIGGEVGQVTALQRIRRRQKERLE
jgi:membrane protein